MSNDVVAIIGAGPAGLVAAKECRESGLTPVVFEKEKAIGGVWHPETGKVWHSMRANLSHFHLGFSDFPFPADTPDFPDNKQFWSYLNAYKDTHALDKLIHCGQAVMDVSFCAKDNNWHLKLDGKDEVKANYVIFANGVFAQNALLDIEGRDRFKGQIIHSGSYRNAEPFRDKKVCVVGGSFSGYEIASDLAASGVEVTHMFRRPAWVLQRSCVINGKQVPLDLLSYTHSKALDLPFSNETRAKRTIEFFKQNFGNPGDTHPMLKVKEDVETPLSIVISDQYLQQVGNGAITPHRDFIMHLDKDGVTGHLKGHVAADAFIFCSGYETKLPLSDIPTRNILCYSPKDKFQPLILNKSTLHPANQKMGFVGLYRGPFVPVMEMQARVLAATFSGRISYPEAGHSEAGLTHEHSLRAARPRPQFPRSNYVGFMHELGQMVSAQPQNMITDMLSNNIDYPMLPSDFRYEGPGSNPGLADAQRERLAERLAI